jgi:hypothetical protein
MQMSQAPVAGTRIGPTQLRALLDKAKGNSSFRDKLIGSPEATLQAEGLRPDSHWVDFFGELQPGDFEKRINSQINIQDGEGEGLG